VVQAAAGVAKVEARIEREFSGVPNALGVFSADPVGLLAFAPANAQQGGTPTGAPVGLWEAEWIASGLVESFYRIAITVTDSEGHQYTDNSLRFSDPIAGNDAIGSVNYPNSGMRRLDALPLVAGDNYLASAVIDLVGGHAYFGTYTIPARVIKVALGNGAEPPVRVGALTLEAGEDRLWTAVIDESGGHAYFGTWTVPGRVVKVAFGGASEPPVRVGAVTLEPGEDVLISGVIDPAGGHAYFGTR
jgi:hypothetical protein